MNRKRDVVTPPRCKTSASRATAYRLLGELVRDCPTNFELLINKLIAHHTLEEPRDQWAYQPAAYEKAPCGYVGLKNMGATCYMNSLMQQFFMIPQFRYGILSVPDRSPDKNESLLYQLQAIFVNLQESEKKFYDPKSFCRAYKPDGQPVNPSIQMDVDEFFNMLFDKLETLLKGTPQVHIFTNNNNHNTRHPPTPELDNSPLVSHQTYFIMTQFYKHFKLHTFFFTSDLKNGNFSPIILL